MFAGNCKIELSFIRLIHPIGFFLNIDISNIFLARQEKTCVHVVKNVSWILHIKIKKMVIFLNMFVGVKSETLIINECEIKLHVNSV